MSRVGILFVHGIGEQKRFEHLEGEARQIVNCLKNDPDTEKVNVIVRTSATSAYHAEQSTWRAEGEAPVCVEIKKKNGEQITLELREVWWADLDERSTLGSQVSFWLWGLSQWIVERYQRNELKLSDIESLNLPGPCWEERPIVERAIIRLKLFFISMFFSLVLSTLSIANFVVARLFSGTRIPGPDIISSYIGDVKLLTQNGRVAKGQLTDMGLPPRVSVRRRVVSSLVDMAMADYDRWYVAAHSLGSVVALNGLMETALALPNYLDEKKWRQCREHNISNKDGEVLGPLGGENNEQDATGKVMLPPRPLWLSEHSVIYRERLFARLDGLLTYGSPLDKFSALWPNIVRTNPSSAFNESFEWINVFDETDPVAGPLNDFSPPPGESKSGPQNFAFTAYPVLLLSHLHYLDFKNINDGRLVNRLCSWCVDGGQFPKPNDQHKLWQAEKPRPIRSASRYAQWAAAFLVLATLFGYLLNQLDGLISWMNIVAESTPWLCVGLGFAFSAALISGAARWSGLHRCVGKIAEKMNW